MDEAQGELSNVSTKWQKRFIQPDLWGDLFDQIKFDPEGQIPSLGTIFEGIRGGKQIPFRAIDLLTLS